MAEFSEKKSDNYSIWGWGSSADTTSSDTSSIKMCKIDDYLIENNIVNGFFVSPMGDIIPKKNNNNGKASVISAEKLKRRDEHCVCSNNNLHISFCLN